MRGRGAAEYVRVLGLHPFEPGSGFAELLLVEDPSNRGEDLVRDTVLDGLLQYLQAAPPLRLGHLVAGRELLEPPSDPSCSFRAFVTCPRMPLSRGVEGLPHGRHLPDHLLLHRHEDRILRILSPLTRSSSSAISLSVSLRSVTRGTRPSGPVACALVRSSGGLRAF
jgi:hypothetical protein